MFHLNPECIGFEDLKIFLSIINGSCQNNSLDQREVMEYYLIYYIENINMV